MIDFFLGDFTPAEILANIEVFLKILIALVLGLLVGYERSYHGRAAGMRTYALVCMASCSLIAICGDVASWYGGQGAVFLRNADPGRIIQGITTGIGFLGAGVIMRDGLNISGLTTAASIWSVSAIGVLIGVGFYGVGGMFAVVLTISMMWGSKIENLLPQRHAVAVTLLFHRNADLTQEDVARLMHSQGYEVAGGSFSINQTNDHFEWRFVAVSHGRKKSATLVKLSESLRKTHGIHEFTIEHARN